VLQVVENAILDPRVIARALDYAEAQILRDRSGDQREALTAELADVDAGMKRLTAVIVAGGELASLITALDTYDRRHKDLLARLAALRTPQLALDPDSVRQQLESYVVD
jgi:hypothetical protein